MLQNYKAKREEGFTIIEVLIVLAIAGLILVIVFLAVPNLQRSARNNSRKNDASRISTAASDYVSNSNGQLPAAGNATVASTVLSDAGTLGQFTLTGGTAPGAGKFAIVTGAKSLSALGTPVDNAVLLDENAKCDTANPGATVTGTTRELALIYPVETTSGFQYVCLDI